MSIEKEVKLQQGRVSIFPRLIFVCALIIPAFYSLSTFGALNGASLGGDLTVSPNGAANYRVMLITPPSVLKPALSVSYSSQLADGDIGVGWSLGGLSQISRCPRTKEIDGVEDGVVGLLSSDRLCLDGQRLILKSGSAYGASGAEYRTRIESFTKIVGYGDFGSTSSWFKVWRKNGEVLEFGNTSDSRALIAPLSNTSVPHSWSLSKVSDRFGNYYNVSYMQDSGYLYPKSIKYSGNSSVGIAPNREIKFEWGGGVARPDELLLHVGGGGRVRIRYRLQSISNDVNSAHYKFNYQLSESSASNMTKLQYCIDSAEADCLAIDARYGYEKNPVDGKRLSDPQLVLAQFGVAQGWVDFNVNPRTLADVNGDGRPDIVGFANDGVYLAFGSASGSSAPVKKLDEYGATVGGWTDNKKFPRFVLDINGDGLADIVGFGANGVTVSLSTGEGFTQPAVWVAAFGGSVGWTEQVGYRRELADANGDGLLDIVGVTKSGQVYVALNNKTNFSLPVLNSTMYLWPDYNYGAVDLTEKSNPMQIADVNSDGKADIVIWMRSLNPQISYGSPTGFKSFALMAFDYSSYANIDPSQIPYPDMTKTDMSWDSTYISNRKMTDVDGDGLLDILGVTAGVYVQMQCAFGCENAVGNRRFRKNSADVWVSYNLGDKNFSIPKKLRDGGGYVLDDLNYEYYASLILSSYEIADVGGDFRDDLINYTSTCAKIGVSTASGLLADECLVNGFTPESGAWDAVKHARIVADIDGDGFPDILGFGDAGVYVSLNNASFPRQVLSFNNGVSESSITYGSLVEPILYKKGQGALFPVVDLQQPMHVVSALDAPDGLGGRRNMIYRYGALRYDFNLGSLGFQWNEVMDFASGTINYMEHKQEFPYIGSVVKEQTQHCSSIGQIPWQGCEVISQEISDWSVRISGDVPDRKVYMPIIERTKESNWR